MPTTPGEWGQLITLRGMPVWAFDASFNKTTGFVGKSNITVHVTMQNLLNRPVWSTPGFLGTVNITRHQFGVSTNPVNNGTPRNLYTRVTVRFSKQSGTMENDRERSGTEGPEGTEFSFPSAIVPVVLDRSRRS